MKISAIILFTAASLSVCKCQISITLNDVVVAEGQEAIFSCNYSAPTLADKSPTISWFVTNESTEKLANFKAGSATDTYFNSELEGFDGEILSNGDLKVKPSAQVVHNQRYKNIECEVDFGKDGYASAEMTYTVYKFPEDPPSVEVYKQDEDTRVFEMSIYPTSIGNCITGYGYPTPVVTFFKITDGEAIAIENGELGDFSDPSLETTGPDGVTIATTQEFTKKLDASDDKALFQCKVVTSIGDIEDVQTVDMPTFRVTHPTTKAILKVSTDETVLGEQVTLTCEANGYPEPTITINGQEGSSITLEVTKEMQGQTYSCTASNTLNNPANVSVSDYTFSVIYVEEPTVVAPPEAIEYGDLFELKCTSSGFPEPMLSWFKAGAKVSQSGTHTIESATFEDNGAYQCRASNDYEQLDKTATAEIVVNGMMMEREEDEVITATAEETVPLECVVTSNPQASITWSASDETIELGNAIDENTGDFKFSSKINVGPLTSAFSQIKFTCTATNGMETISKQFSLPVIAAQGSSIAGVIIGILVAILLVAVILAVLYNKGIICKKGGKGDETAKDITPGDVPNDGNGDVEAGTTAGGNTEEKEKLMSDNNGETTNES